jgi:tetratricopeptide (TPR) repeat protein
VFSTEDRDASIENARAVSLTRVAAMARKIKGQGRMILLLSILVPTAALIYLPGIGGPFLFDDTSNILQNDFVKLKRFALDDLYHAAYSLKAGPLQRPIAMASFALNYYFAGNFSPVPFKLTNLCIHMVNGLLIFWLLRLIFTRAARRSVSSASDRKSPQTVTVLAAAVALLWIVHPIQLTSVLYVVQRMVELSTLFTLLGLICYLKGRLRLCSQRPGGIMLIVVGMVGWGVLGLLSKENAALLPVFAAILEFTLFSNEMPWRLWPSLSAHKKKLVIVSVFLLVVVSVVAVIAYALPGYANRPFDLPQRLMTETRVLWFYLSLILLPRLPAFGLYHDDIVLSTSLLSPWTTLPSVLGIGALLALSFVVRRSQPLVTLGILWFFAGHLIESTVIPLELVHEHRNYLACLGPLIVIVQLVAVGASRLELPKLWVLLPLITLVFGLTTFQRADQWSDLNKEFRYAVLHHPNSARAQGSLAWLLAKEGNNAEAMTAIRRAAELDEHEPGYLISLNWIAAQGGLELSAADQQETLKSLQHFGVTTLSATMFEFVSDCLRSNCRTLQKPMEQWLRLSIEKKLIRDPSFSYYMLGKTLVAQGRNDEAVNAFYRSYQLDPLYLHPLFELTNLYISLGQTEKATQVLTELRKANRTNPHPRDREIETVARTIESIRSAAARRH